MPFMKILLLEDDIILSEIIEEYLLEQGLHVSLFYDGQEALDAIFSHKYDILLLDVNVPSMNGFELLHTLQEAHLDIPTIFISSLDQIKDVKKGFSLGAEDYLKKPFELEELWARISRTKKLHKIEHSGAIVLADGIVYEPLAYKITVHGVEHKLRNKEAQLLDYFIKHQGKTITFDNIIGEIWPYDESPTHATIRTYVKNLRPLLKEEQIENIKGVGYLFTLQGSESCQ